MENNSLRSKIEAIVVSKRFQNFVMTVIVINGIVLGLETSEAAMAVAGSFLIAVDNLCLAIFVGELLLKIYAMRGRFFKDGWNIFDFLVVGISLVPQQAGLSVLRSLRVLRVMRMISILPTMRRVVAAMLHAMPGVGSVAGIVGIIFYVGAVISTKLFGQCFPEWFGTVGASFYTLFQIMTLESWSMGIVRPVMEIYPHAWLFFVPFILVTTYTVINLVVGIIVSAMEEKSLEEGTRLDPVVVMNRLERRLDSIDDKVSILLKEK
ncbi:ion transporter [Desulfonatronovibrio magnus]|uniref:ion transporter n=1 Tax=Desulfonatronovibrio magnus TaxID=698827 RepID=UPI0005EBA186|nr:ion transporter [Desulfonatronovibrio magnus]